MFNERQLMGGHQTLALRHCSSSSSSGISWGSDSGSDVWWLWANE